MLPMLISLLAVIVNFLTEVAMIMSIIHEVEVISMISNFSAIYIVSQLPHFYYLAINDELKER